MRLRLLICVLTLSLLPVLVSAQQDLWYPFDTDYGTPDCGFGCYSGHLGSDWNCDEGTSIYSSISGTVIEVVNSFSSQTCYESFGNKVTIQNSQGDVQIIYAHLLQNSITVVVNDFVQAGQFIALSSNTGYTLTLINNEWVCQQGGGEHLHFEVRVKISEIWTSVDPYTYNSGMWTNPLQYGNSNTFLATQTGYSITQPGPYTPGQIIDCEVYWRNDGTATWSNQSGLNYVELGSCNSSGTIVTSYLYASGLGWLNDKVPCTFNPGSPTTIVPGATATFSFQGKIPTSAQPGQVPIYFGPVYDGQIMDYWNGNGFTIEVVNPYHVKFDFDGDGIADVWDRTSTGEWHLDYASDNLDGWDWTGYGYGEHLDDPVPADYDGDGKYDLAILKNADHRWYIDYASNGFGDWDISFGGYGGAVDHPCPCDYDGDGIDDISVRDADGDWHIDYSANGFGAWDFLGLGYGGIYDRPAPADYDGDGKCDFAVLRNSDRKFLIDYAINGFGSWDVTNLGGYGGFADYPAPADYDNDGISDIAVLWTSDHTWRVDEAGNGFNGWDYILGGYGGVSDRPIPADYDGDGWDDIACYHVGLDRVCFDWARNNYGAWDWCDAGPYHPTWKVDNQTILPIEFSVDQNYPNPFNPSTTISYSLPIATNVNLEIFNILGQKVITLVDAKQEAGLHVVTWDASQNGSGIYLYRLKTAEAVETKKMVLLK